MIRVYFLPVVIDPQTNTEVMEGLEYVHNAIVDPTADPMVRKLIQDTTDTEHNGLVAVADSWRAATQEEIDYFSSEADLTPTIPPLSRHPATLLDVDIQRVRPVKVRREWLGKNYDSWCFVTEDLAEQWQAGKVQLGDIIIVDYFDSDVDQPVASQKVRKTW